MSVKLYLKDNTTGTIHEYGTNRHDALMVSNGALKYQNLQNGDGTPTGYSFCTVDGAPPKDEEDHLVNIGGDHTGVDCYKCRWRKRHQKCSCCSRNPNMKDLYALDPKEAQRIRKEILG